MIWLVMLVGGLIGYWVVSAMLNHGEPPASAGPLRQPVETRPWHLVLGVAETASLDEVVAAYRSAMNQYHPDKVAHLGEELRDLAEKKCKEINLAYEAALRVKR